MTSFPFYVLADESPGKARILQEGLRLFATKGLASTSIRDIGEAAGLTNPALYKHFATKTDLALVLFERCYREHLRRLTSATQSSESARDKLGAFVLTSLEACDEDPNAAIFVVDNLTTLWPDVAVALKHRTAITILREVLETGRNEGIVSKQQEIELQVSIVVGLIGQIMRQVHLGTFQSSAASFSPSAVKMLEKALA